MCPLDRVEGPGLHRARRGLDGSLVVGAVVAPAEAHTVLLLVEQVGRLVGHDYGHGRGGARGAGCGGDDSGCLHHVMELRQRELDLRELTVRRLGRFVHARRHHGILVLLPRYLGNREDGATMRSRRHSSAHTFSVHQTHRAEP